MGGAPHPGARGSVQGRVVAAQSAVERRASLRRAGARRQGVASYGTLPAGMSADQLSKQSCSESTGTVSGPCEGRPAPVLARDGCRPWRAKGRNPDGGGRGAFSAPPELGRPAGQAGAARRVRRVAGLPGRQPATRPARRPGGRLVTRGRSGRGRCPKVVGWEVSPPPPSRAAVRDLRGRDGAVRRSPTGGNGRCSSCRW